MRLSRLNFEFRAPATKSKAIRWGVWWIGARFRARGYTAHVCAPTWACSRARNLRTFFCLIYLVLSSFGTLTYFCFSFDTDVDECQATDRNKCHKKATCNNTLGSYKCTCLNGYSGNGTLCEGQFFYVCQCCFILIWSPATSLPEWNWIPYLKLA